MLTRRTLLRGAGATVAGSLLSADLLTDLLTGEPRSAGAAPASTLRLDLINRRRGRTAYAVVSGIDPATGQWFFLAGDGRTRYTPAATGRPQTPLAKDVAIALPSTGATRRVTLPRLISGRIYFSYDRKLQFFVNPGGGITTPSVTNPSDPNAATEWAFAELTFDRSGVYANISFVDFVALPIRLQLTTGGATQHVGGLSGTGLAAIAAGLRAQSERDRSGWGHLVVRRDRRDLRVLSPNLAAAAAGGRSPVAGYLAAYIDQAWQRYRSTDLIVDTQSSWGRRTGRVGRDGRLTFPGAGSFARPSTDAVFNCSVAPFVTTNDLMGNLSARLAAALNRTTLVSNARHPDTSPRAFYRTARTNHYARLVHAHTANGAGYAFPYDDVHAGGWNAEGRVVAPDPRTLTVWVG